VTNKKLIFATSLYERRIQIMQARMTNPAMIFPKAIEALLALSKASETPGVPARTLELVHLRASQINGCSVCLDLHSAMAKSLGETDERLFTLAGWRDTPYFTDAERAALALTEAVTRLSDRSDPVSDEVWNEAVRHYDEKGLASLLFHIAVINVWNRLHVPTRTVTGEWVKAQAKRLVETATAAGR
jgi:AhpD family alkylhydroperoxidase